jgi:hypothetical protein
METFVETLQKLVEREVTLALTKAISLAPDNGAKAPDGMTKVPIQLTMLIEKYNSRSDNLLD